MRKPPIRQRLVIHAGRHKTASTSLLTALGLRDIPDLHYIRLCAVMPRGSDAPKDGAVVFEGTVLFEGTKA